jgi:hypothetical protein
MASTLEAWQEVAKVTITPINAGAVEFAALTETIDVDQGDKDIEGLALTSGGRLAKFTPEADTSIKLELYPLGISTVTAANDLGVAQFFHTASGSWDTSQPLSVSNSTKRENYRIALLWTNDTTNTSAAGAVASGSSAYRYVLKNAYLTSIKTSFTDKILKVTATFKAPPFKKDGTANITEESTDGTAAMTALSAYT